MCGNSDKTYRTRSTSSCTFLCELYVKDKLFRCRWHRTSSHRLLEFSVYFGFPAHEQLVPLQRRHPHRAVFTPSDDKIYVTGTILDLRALGNTQTFNTGFTITRTRICFDQLRLVYMFYTIFRSSVLQQLCAFVLCLIYSFVTRFLFSPLFFFSPYCY